MSRPDRERVCTLNRQIREAFDNVPYPGDDNIVDAEPPGTCAEADELKVAYMGKHWKNLDAGFLRLNNAVCFFKPRGFQFFLPACMLACIETYEEVDLLSSSVLNALLQFPYVESGGGGECLAEKTKLLSRAQREVIASFLEYMRDEHPDEFEYHSSEKRSARVKKRLARAIKFFNH